MTFFTVILLDVFLSSFIISDKAFYRYLVFMVHKHRINPMSGDEGIRTPDPLLARQVLSQLSYTPKGVLDFSVDKLMGSSGLEPPTSRLSAECSNQLSYKPLYL